MHRTHHQRHHHATLLALVTLATTLALGATPAQAHRTTPEQKFQLAMEAQTHKEFATMLRLLRQAATEGDREAQEMLGLALLIGPTLYGPAVKADRCEATMWLRRAAAQGSEVGKAQLDFVNRLREEPEGKRGCQAWG
jgi:TPR repeat protein